MTWSTVSKAVAVVALILYTSALTTAQLVPTPRLQSPEWRLQTSAEGTFVADWPCEPMRRNVSADARPLYEYNCGTAFDSALLFYSAMVMEGDTAVDNATVENVLGSMVRSNKQIVESSPLASGVGREAVIRNTSDPMDNSRVRVIAVGSRCYIAGVSATDIQALKSPAAERFFSSFKPLGPK